MSAACEVLEFLKSDNSSVGSSESSKKLNEKLKALYRSELFAHVTKNPGTKEEIRSYFNNLFKEPSPVVVEAILMTTLKQFGTYSISLLFY